MKRDPVPVNSILAGDCLDWLKRFDDASFTAVVTDPPYGLSKQPDMREVLRHWLDGDDYEHRGAGFMGLTWDSFVPGPKVWEEVFRVMKPGAHVLSMSGSRTYDLMTLAMRLASFEVRDKIDVYCSQSNYKAWCYGCLTEDAEILTEHGWKKGIEVMPGERVACWDAQSGRVVIEPVSAVTTAPYCGDMVRFRNQYIDAIVTPNHRVYYKQCKRCRRFIKDGKPVTTKVEPDWVVREASEFLSVPGSWGYYRLPMAGVHDGEGLAGGIPYAQLLAWVWTEGGFDAVGTGVRIWQSSVNASNVKMIQKLLNDVVPGHKKYERTRAYKGREYVEHCWYFSGEAAVRVRGDLPAKQPTWELVWKMSQAEKLAFIDAAMLGDGSTQKGVSRRAFYQKAQSGLEIFQSLTHLTGNKGYVNPRKRCVGVRMGTTIDVRVRDHISREHYDGMVWCVTVPTGAFISRRAGLVFIMGNSGFPKSHNISKAIDKTMGAKRKVVGMKKGKGGENLNVLSRRGNDAVDAKGCGAYGQGAKQVDIDIPITVPATLEAGQWEGHGTALKPANEPIADFGRADEQGCVERLDDEDQACFLYQAKAPKKERNRGCEHLLWVVEKSGPRAVAEDEYAALEAENERREGDKGYRKHRLTTGNCWPTVKPLALARWLVRLVKMPEKNLVLDPFVGSGTTAVACVLEGVPYIGIDASPAAVRIANARIAHWKEHRDEFLAKEAEKKAREAKKAAEK